jgi:hypothetical protein
MNKRLKLFHSVLILAIASLSIITATQYHRSREMKQADHDLELTHNAVTGPDSPPSPGTDKPGIFNVDPSGNESASSEIPGEPISINPDTIPNEYILNFSDNANMRRFISDANDFGVVILGVIDGWNSLRIRTEDMKAFQDILDQYPGGVEYNHNYYVRTPDIAGYPVPVDGSNVLTDGNLVPFGNNTLSWLGVQGDPSSRGQGVLVAILDTGVENHSTFKDCLIERVTMLPDSANATGDYAGHGTAVASIIAGNLPEAPGVAPGVSILSIQVLDGDGVGDLFTLAAGIIEAVDYGADIINLSLGSYGHNPVLQQAVDYAIMNNVPIIAAVGNDGVAGVMYPARYPEVIAMTSVDAMGQNLPYANQGTEVDLAAPGYAVQTAWTDEQIARISGTSLSTAIGTAAMALLYDPGVDFRDNLDLMLNYSNDAGAPGQDPEYGTGILDIGRIQNRNVPGILDIAVTGNYLPVQADNRQMTLIVGVQNQGTEDLSPVTLTVAINDDVRTIGFNHVEVGEILSADFPIDLNKVDPTGTIIIHSSVSIDGVEDHNIANNTKTSMLVFE